MRKLGFLVGILLTFNGFAQNSQPKCGTDEAMHEYYLNHPDQQAQIDQDRQELEAFTQAWVQNGIRSTNTYIIPVVFHVLHEGGTENISDEQIEDAMYVLNRDYSLRNPDTVDVIDAFKPLLSDSDIEFRLAKRDPNGIPTTGIIREFTSETNMADDAIKPGRQWPRANYLNIYVVKTIGSGAAGYTYIPGTTSQVNDGILVQHSYVGRIGTSTESNSRTLTHECGHWLDLYHVWGDGNNPGDVANCTSNNGNGDYVNDTPFTEGQSGGCDTLAATCDGSQDNVQNYMNYSNCDKMFTIGQMDRMHAALESSTASRNNLWSSTNLSNTGVNQLCEARFVSSSQIVCAGNFIQYEDVSVATSSGWDWTFENGIPSASAAQYPSIYYSALGTQDVTLEATLGGTTESVTKSDYMFVVDPIGRNYPYSEGFENVSALPSTYWHVDNPDGSANKWQLATNASYSGSNSAVLKNLGNNEGAIDVLTSGTIDLAQLSSASFTFKYAFAQVNSSTDKVRLYFSADCGETWTFGWLGVGSVIATAASQSSEFVPSSTSEWDTYTVNTIPASLLQEDFMYKFEFESDSGNQFYIDDINIFGTYNPFPVLETPFDGAVNLSDGPLLNWKSVENCDEYEYQLDTSPSFNTGNLQTGTTTFISSNPDGTDTEWQASGLTHDETYYWRVRAVTNSIPSVWSETWEFNVSETGVGYEDMFNPEYINLRVIPNPISSNGWINFNSEENARVRITMYNVLGELVQEMEQNALTTGNQSVPFNTSGLKKGVYFIKLDAGSNSETTRFVVK